MSVRVTRPNRGNGQDLRDVPTYTIPEAATFLAVPSRTLHYWFSGKNRVFRPAGDYDNYSLLSFQDVAEAYMLYVLRHFHDFSAARIRHSLENLRKETKSKHPLFHADLSVFDSRLIFEKKARGTVGRQYVDLSNHRQLALPGIVDIYRKRILQDEHKQPLRMFPWRLFSEDNDSRPVSLDPEVLSGRLVVTGTRIPVATLQGLKAANKSLEEIAENYGLGVEVVQKALKHIEKPILKVA